MVYCLNPNCPKPENPDHHKFCHGCGIPLVYLLKDRYKILKILGSGGFGRTFLAEDQDKLNEKCVVKQLVPENQGTGAIAKVKQLFEDEAKRLQQLGNHPQIPSLFAYFEDNNRLYLVQEWIDGEDLEEELQNQGFFNEDKIRDLLNQILAILEIVHEQDVIHRDIKPVNIMRRRSPQTPLNKGGLNQTPQTPLTKGGLRGDIVLIDFGVAKQQTASAMQRTGTAIGSQGYAAIEQLQGKEAFPSSDLFSLGATCFHLLTGIHPYHLFLDEGYSWVRNWRNHLNQSISKNLEEVLDKLLQKDHLKRYQSAQDVITALNYTPPPPPPPPVPQAISQPVPQPIPQPRPKPKPKPKYQPPAQHQTPLLIIGMMIFLGLGGYTISQTPIFKGTTETPIKKPDKINDKTPAKKPQKINDENLALINTLTGHSSRVSSLQFSPDGKTLASGSEDKTIKLWDVTTGQIKATLKGHSGEVLSVQFSPDGKTLASGSGNKTIKLWDVTTGQIKATLKGHSGEVLSVQFSPDGKTLASGSGNYFSSPDNTIKLWDVATGQLKSTLKGHLRQVNSVQFSPNGKTLASGSADNTIKLWDVATGQVKSTLKDHVRQVNSVRFSPNGKTLASGSEDNTIKLWDVATGQLKSTLTGHSNWVYSVQFSPDGKTLASGSGDNTIKLWDVATGKVKSTFKGNLWWALSVQFSPDGKTLASGSADETIKLWRVK